MPTYQYRCTTCDNEVEAVQKFTDPALTECPECHGRLRKVFSPVGVVFKGSGFYATDNRTKGKTHAVLPAGMSESSSSSSTDSSSAPAPAPEKKSDSSAKTSKPAGGSSSAA